MSNMATNEENIAPTTHQVHDPGEEHRYEIQSRPPLHEASPVTGLRQFLRQRTSTPRVETQQGQTKKINLSHVKSQFTKGCKKLEENFCDDRILAYPNEKIVGQLKGLTSRWNKIVLGAQQKFKPETEATPKKMMAAIGRRYLQDFQEWRSYLIKELERRNVEVPQIDVLQEFEMSPAKDQTDQTYVRTPKKTSENASAKSNKQDQKKPERENQGSSQDGQDNGQQGTHQRSWQKETEAVMRSPQGSEMSGYVEVHSKKKNKKSKKPGSLQGATIDFETSLPPRQEDIADNLQEEEVHSAPLVEVETQEVHQEQRDESLDPRNFVETNYDEDFPSLPNPVSLPFHGFPTQSPPTTQPICFDQISFSSNGSLDCSTRRELSTPEVSRQQEDVHLFSQSTNEEVSTVVGAAVNNFSDWVTGRLVDVHQFSALSQTVGDQEVSQQVLTTEDLRRALEQVVTEERTGHTFAQVPSSNLTRVGQNSREDQEGEQNLRAELLPASQSDQVLTEQDREAGEEDEAEMLIRQEMERQEHQRLELTKTVTPSRPRTEVQEVDESVRTDRTYSVSESHHSECGEYDEDLAYGMWPERQEHKRRAHLGSEYLGARTPSAVPHQTLPFTPTSQPVEQVTKRAMVGELTPILERTEESSSRTNIEREQDNMPFRTEVRRADPTSTGAIEKAVTRPDGPFQNFECLSSARRSTSSEDESQRCVDVQAEVHAEANRSVSTENPESDISKTRSELDQRVIQALVGPTWGIVPTTTASRDTTFSANLSRYLARVPGLEDLTHVAERTLQDNTIIDEGRTSSPIGNTPSRSSAPVPVGTPRVPMPSPTIIGMTRGSRGIRGRGNGRNFEIRTPSGSLPPGFLNNSAGVSDYSNPLPVTQSFSFGGYGVASTSSQIPPTRTSTQRAPGNVTFAPNATEIRQTQPVAMDVTITDDLRRTGIQASTQQDRVAYTQTVTVTSGARTYPGQLSQDVRGFRPVVPQPGTTQTPVSATQTISTVSQDNTVEDSTLRMPVQNPSRGVSPSVQQPAQDARPSPDQQSTSQTPTTRQVTSADPVSELRQEMQQHMQAMFDVFRSLRDQISSNSAQARLTSSSEPSSRDPRPSTLEPQGFHCQFVPPMSENSGCGFYAADQETYQGAP